MKKIIFSALLVASGFAASAQSIPSNTQVGTYEPTRVSTSEDVRQLANKLELNEGQYIRLRDLMRARQEQVAEINSMYSNDPQMRTAKINAVQQDFESNLAQSVSKKQYNAYLAATGRSATTTESGFQAGGYGGRSLEGAATNGAGNTNDAAKTTAPANQK